MDKKQIMKMNDKWKNFRLTESKIMVNGVQHGFDLTDFKPGGFKRFLKALGIPAIAKGSHQGSSWSNGNNYYWRNKDIIIITANNPITGNIVTLTEEVQKKITHHMLELRQELKNLWTK